MNGLLKRFWFLTKCTIGELYFDGTFCCYILEDLERADGIKIPGETCIPSGLKLKIGRVYSPKHKKIVPIIYTDIEGAGDTPDDYIIKGPNGIVFRAVEIHIGNFAKDTHGCQLPGLKKDLFAPAVWKSAPACDIVYKKIFDALDRGEEITYTIIHDLPENAHEI